MIRIARLLAFALVLSVSIPVRAGLITNGDFSSYTAGATVPNNNYIAHIGNGDPTTNGPLNGMGTLTDWTIFNGTSTVNTNAALAYAYLFSTANQNFLWTSAAAPPNGSSNFLGVRGDNGSAHGVNSTHTTTAWMHDSFTFTATASSEVLKFLAVSPVVQGPPTALLTNIDLESVAVPEPSTLVSLGLGGIAFVAIGLRRRARALKTA